LKAAQDNLKQNSNSLKVLADKKTKKEIEIKKLDEEIIKTQKDFLSASIVAPTDGKIVNLNIKFNETVKKDKLLFTIEPYDYYVIAGFNYNQAKKLKKGQKAFVYSPKYKFRRFRAVVDEIEETLNTDITSLKTVNEEDIKSTQKTIAKIKLKTNISKYNIEKDSQVKVRVKTR